MLKSIRWLVLLVFSLYIISGQVLAQTVCVTVADRATVRGPVITLGELAEVSGDDSERIRALQQLKLGSAPLPGNSVVLTSELLGLRLTAAGGDYSGVSWQVPAAVTVTTGSQVVSGQMLVDSAREAILSQIGTAVSAAEFKITAASNPQDILAPQGNLNIAVDLPYGIRYNVPTTVNVAIQVDDRLFTKVVLKFDVRRFQQVVVTAGSIPARQIITPDLVRYERLDSGRLSPGYYTDINKVIGLMVSRPLFPGLAVNDSMLAKPLLVKRGSAVNIIARIGDIEVQAAGQALQDGSQGQIIRVQNNNSKKIVSARVLDESAVQVVTYSGR